MDILNCNWETSKYFIFSLENVFDPVIYYSHLISLLGAIFIGIFILLNNKSLINKIFFTLTGLFSLWVYFDLILWASEKPQIIMFFWSSIVYVEYFMFVTSFWLVYVFLFKKNVSNFYKIIFILFFIPIIIFNNTEYSLIAFDLSNCDRGAFEGPLISYLYIIEVIIFLLTLFIVIKSFVQNKNNIDRRKNTIFSIGILSFMGIFFVGNITLIANLGWNYEQYKLFGMVLFLLIILFMIVRFKTFNAKLMGAQALVWIMIILIGSQFIFIRNNINRILNSITFLAVSVSGLILTRSVKKVDSQRELLEQTNINQQSLLHFITHQVKGYMTKSRNIFDGMLAGDYGELNSKVKEMAKYGFESETKGVETVQSILKASDLRTGRTRFTKIKTNISRMVADLMENRQNIAHQKHLDLTFEIEPNIESTVDPLQLNEVFKNLISNALLYTPKGTVHVVLKKDSKNIKFAVIDTGFGLNDEDKKKLFTEGGKGKESLTLNIDSTGYGLFIAREIVQQHQGKIGAYSDGRGKGSEFFVILPNLE